MADQDNIWFRLGYTLESAAQRARPAPRLRPLGERERARADDRHEPRAARKVGAARRPRPEPIDEAPPVRPDLEETEEADDADALGPLASFLKGASPTGETWEAVVSAIGATVVGRLLDAMPRKRRPGPIRLLHAAAAGAGAALVRELARPLISGVPDERPLADRARSAAIAGTARGLLYGALVEPRLPGPPVVRGTMYGLVEHLVSPLGGLITLAGARAPHRNIPVVSALFEELEQADDTLFDHILFGIGLAALYGARPADVDEEDDDDDDEDDED